MAQVSPPAGLLSAGSLAPGWPSEQSAPERAARLRGEPRTLCATGWAPKASPEKVARRVARLEAGLGRDLDARFCRHAAGPPICWCRKPLPGLGVALILEHALDPARCLWVGTSAADRGMASRLGVPYVDADAYFDPG